MTMNRYFECKNCGQVVQGFEASRQVECCNHPQYVEIPGPEDQIWEAICETEQGRQLKAIYDQRGIIALLEQID